jgi:hypothetical protein
MPRLFITSKEIEYMNDVVKEVIKDIVGQKIFYYPVSKTGTKVDKIYNESDKKVFENPIELDVLIGQPQWEGKFNKFGYQQNATVEILVQARDLIDKRVQIFQGDYFVYGDAAFEIVSYLNMNNIFGQEEYESAYKIIGKLALPGEFDSSSLFNPTKESIDNSGIQNTFEQQRGIEEDSSGKPTGDIRQVQERLKQQDDLPPVAMNEGPRKVIKTKGFYFDE